MRSAKKSVRCKQSPPAGHHDFMAMVPKIETHAQRAFRQLNAEARGEAVQEVVCNACAAVARLVELDKVAVAYPSALARFGVAQTRGGRKVGGRLNVRDVSSPYCQREKGLTLDRLDGFDKQEEAWLEMLLEDRHAGPAEVAAMRMDFAAWLQGLPRRLRKVATFLAGGETTTAAARRFRVSPGRISQLRKELFHALQRFQGEEPAAAVA
jgi:hypothetical protein